VLLGVRECVCAASVEGRGELEGREGDLEGLLA
jgi:hypothetical protein